MITEKESRFGCPQGCTTLTDGICLVHPGLEGDMVDLLGMPVAVYPGKNICQTFLPIEIEVTRLQNATST